MKTSLLWQKWREDQIDSTNMDDNNNMKVEIFWGVLIEQVASNQVCSNIIDKMCVMFLCLRRETSSCSTIIY